MMGKVKCIVEKCPEMGKERCVFPQKYIDDKKEYDLEICPCGNKVKLIVIEEGNNE